MVECLELAAHIVTMADDAYLSGHPEWIEIVKEAESILDNSGASII